MASLVERVSEFRLPKPSLIQHSDTIPSTGKSSNSSSSSKVAAGFCCSLVGCPLLDSVDVAFAVDELGAAADIIAIEGDGN